jgi:hypothetical protein
MHNYNILYMRERSKPHMLAVSAVFSMCMHCLSDDLMPPELDESADFQSPRGSSPLPLPLALLLQPQAPTRVNC